ncbi:WD40-repeat-containing domain protein [Gaertneriomyces semiglobifer]|nr:WD40-repeat-containing domain protein [Gaertneriomyces semiglobifer]
MALPPESINCASQVFSFAFHPREDIIAAGTIDGAVECYRYAAGKDAESSFSLTAHKGACRALAFSRSGDHLYSASSDKSLRVLDVSTGKTLLKKPKAHSESLNVLATVGEGLVASGDDAGCVKLWDLRQRKVAQKWTVSEDFVSDFWFEEGKRTLLVTSGDGVLSVLDPRKGKPVAQSANQEVELLSVCAVRNTTKAIIGTEDGTLLLFNWGEWGDCTDRFPGHPGSVDSMCKIDESTVVTACSDGVRAVGVLPFGLKGIVGATDLPMEQVGVDRTGTWVAGCGHDTVVRFWALGDDFRAPDSEQEADANNDEQADEKPNLQQKRQKDSDDDSDASSNDEKAQAKKKKKRQKAKRGIGSTQRASSTFFADID